MLVEVHVCLCSMLVSMHMCICVCLLWWSLGVSIQGYKYNGFLSFPFLAPQLIGGPPNPDHDSDENVVSVFINQVINPEKPLASAVSALLTETAHIAI